MLFRLRQMEISLSFQCIHKLSTLQWFLGSCSLFCFQTNHPNSWCGIQITIFFLSYYFGRISVSTLLHYVSSILTSSWTLVIPHTCWYIVPQILVYRSCFWRGRYSTWSPNSTVYRWRGQVVHVQVMTLNVKVLAVRLGNKLPPLRGNQDTEIALEQPPITGWGQQSFSEWESEDGGYVTFECLHYWNYIIHKLSYEELG
jgi:hypothetical protein